MKLFTWTKELEDTLTTMWRNGFSSGVIGEKLGINRSAVIGKLDRLGMLKERKGRPKVTLPRNGTPTPRKIVRRPTSEPIPKNISLVDLKRNQCKWPHGTYDYTFCGHRTEPGRNYCPYHDAISRVTKD